MTRNSELYTYFRINGMRTSDPDFRMRKNGGDGRRHLGKENKGRKVISREKTIIMNQFIH